MIFLNELEYNRIYRKPFHLPINEKDKRHGSSIFLLTPNLQSSINVLNNPLIVNKNTFESYFIEKDITYYINNEGYMNSNPVGYNIINEEFAPTEDRMKPYAPYAYWNKDHTKLTAAKFLPKDLKVASTRSTEGFEFNVDTSNGNITSDGDGWYIAIRDIEKGEEFILTSKDINPILRDNINEHSLSDYLDGDGDELVSDNPGENIFVNKIQDDYEFTDTHLRYKTENGDVMILFNENLDEDILNENSNHSSILNKLLYKERMRSDKEVYEIYDIVRDAIPTIRRTYPSYPRYKGLNLFIDLYYYNYHFFRRNVLRLDKGIDLYFDFINRFIHDKRLIKEGYNKKTIFIPIHGWETEESNNIYDYKENLNPISTMLRMLQNQQVNRLDKWSNIDVLVMSNSGYIKLDLSTLTKQDIPRLRIMFEKLYTNNIDDIQTDNIESKKSMVANIVDKIETSQKVKINNLTGDGEEISKDELVEKINKAVATSADEDEALDKLNQDKIKDILIQLSSDEENNVNITNARLSRMQKLNDKFYEQEINGKSVKELLSNTNNIEELPITELKLDTVNDEWKKLQYINFEKAYNIDEDIAAILESFSKLTIPVAVRDIDIENTSTSEDLKNTYNVKMEDIDGNRFTIKFDVPIFKDDKFMMLRGNDKTINGQLVLLPISKTDSDTVQIVSNYKKIFIRRYGAIKGKSCVTADRINKTLDRCVKVKTTIGDNSKICNKYELPIDYIDLSSIYSTIETSKHRIYFNQDEIRKKYKIDESRGMPYGIDKKTNDILYYNEGMFSGQLQAILSLDTEFAEMYDTTNVSTRYMYSQASILNNKIPLIVIMAYNEGLTKALEKAHVGYEFVEKRPKYNKDVQDIIKFNDGYILYDLDYNSSMLLNGLKACNTEDYSLTEVNNKAMYLDFLDIFGGRILADGLDNFYDLMIDPITEEVLRDYKLPTDYVELLAYGNMLLSDNKYIKHTDMRSDRYRSNEIVAGYVYQALSEGYEDYRLAKKRGRKPSMSVKQSIVLDKVLSDPTCSDKSTLNDLLNAELINSVSFKGLSGMNSDRGYSLDKRTFDTSMLNILGMSTGFAGNVGITRQATMDMNIQGKRGYLKINENTDNLSITKTFTATEALTPFGSTRDDPFRSAMTFIQTSKHAMRVKHGMPLLISNGADQALPYLTPNDFSYKAKHDGEVIEVTESFMVVKYKTGECDMIDLRDNIKKNSNGGFYISVQLSTKLKQGKKFKANDILAYDELSYSDMVGHTDNISYNLGTMAKIAILNTDEGFEDSAIISEWLSEAMATDVVIQKDVVLPKSTNLYNMVKKGDPVQEGDPLLVFQNAFEEDDINILLKNLTDGDEELVSELGRIPIKSKITGEVKDIKMYRTVEKDECSDSLKKKINEYEKNIKDIKGVMKKYDISYLGSLDADYKLEKSGKLKNVEDGVLIEFYLKYEDKMSVGDKLIYYSALKGVIKDIFPEGKEPYTALRPDEKIHSLLSQGSVIGRMVCSVKYNLAINKILIELDRKVKDIAGIKWSNIDDM
ncbi:MAG: hypothetical protein ACRCXT_10485 [Paraclostridium sp.]